MSDPEYSFRDGVFGSSLSAQSSCLPALLLPALLFLALLFLAWMLPAFARADGSGDNWLKEQMRQSTLALRQLQDENSALQAKLSAAQKAAAKVDEAKASRAEEERNRTAMTSELAGLRAELDAAHAQITLLKQEQRDADARLVAAAASERTLTDIAARTTSCEKNNRDLVVIADELQQQYRDMSVWKALWQAEPVTGIGRVQRESIAEKYRGRIIDASIRTSTTPDSNERK